MSFSPSTLSRYSFSIRMSMHFYTQTQRLSATVDQTPNWSVLASIYYNEDREMQRRGIDPPPPLPEPHPPHSLWTSTNLTCLWQNFLFSSSSLFMSQCADICASLNLQYSASITDYVICPCTCYFNWYHWPMPNVQWHVIHQPDMAKERSVCSQAHVSTINIVTQRLFLWHVCM